MTGSQKAEKSPLSGFLSYFYGNFIVLLLGFIQTPLVTRLMTADEYGKTGMFETTVSMLYIFAILGMDQTYIRYYYKNGIDRGRLLKNCLTVSLILVGVLIVIYTACSGSANMFLFGKTGLDITLLVIAYTLISVFERYFFLDVRMQQNGKLYSNINITQKILNILLIVVAVFFLGNDFRVVLYAMTLSWGTTTLFLVIRYFYLKKNKEIYIAENSDEAEVRSYPVKELLSYGAPYILVLLMEWLLSSCDRVAIRTWSSFEELGIYTAAMKIMVLLITFKTTFVAFWSPVAMEKYENASQENCRIFFKRAFDVTRTLCALAAIMLILFRGVIVLLLGRDYRGADRLIPFLTLMPVFAMLFEITNQGIKFVKKNMYLNIASAAAIIINISGNALMVPVLGGLGAAMTTGISYIIYFAIGSFVAERFYRVGYDYLRTGITAFVLITECFAAVYMDLIPSVFVALAGVVLLAFLEKESYIFMFKYIKGYLKRGKN
ncbi:MAG: lipopolysaccharide biosynthesis protein [Lachnospiraceae bacterium]|nr:lipopolysaccharide biosynthesis protein [Lachnospiraceae bacterium]